MGRFVHRNNGRIILWVLTSVGLCTVDVTITTVHSTPHIGIMYPMKKYQKSSESACRICGFTATGKNLTNHIAHEHKLDSHEYTVKYILGGIEPKCPVCGRTPRYSAFRFKKYCKDHRSVAESLGGSIGGKAEAWNRGKTKETDERLALAAIKMSGPANPFFGQTHTEETRRRISQSKTLNRQSLEDRIHSRESEFELVTPIEEYWSRQGQYLEFKCKTCGTVQPKTLQSFERGSRCYKCFPESKSLWELEVFEYVKSKFPDAVTGDRIVLSPKEVDVYVPSLKIGFECHGLYWHSEGCACKDPIDKRTHIDKLELAERSGVRLYQFFSDEWRDKRTICTSIIDHKLGVSPVKVHARKAKVVDVSIDQQREFFNSTHISGYVPSQHTFGLLIDGKLVAALGVRRPRQTSKYTGLYEISRYSVLPGHSVVGGLNRLVKHATEYAVSNKMFGLMTYVDRRLGDGHGYMKCGFNLIGSTGIDYWYTDNTMRYDRFKFRAQNGLSEKEVAVNARVSRIWGCGSLVFENRVICQ